MKYFVLTCVTLLTAFSVAAQNVDMDVPFVTTPPAVTEAMLNIARVGPKDFVLDLGSGDGRIVILAARKFGARGLGVEIDPSLVSRSRDYAKRAGVQDRAEFREQDLFATDFSQASVITMYLLPDVNMALRPKLLALKPGTRIVSHDWHMGDWLPDAELRVAAPDKPLGLDKSSRVMLWTVPADAAGRWCNADKPGAELLLRQKFQQIDGELLIDAKKSAVKGKIDGSRLVLDEKNVAAFEGGKLTFAPSTGPAGIDIWRRAVTGC
jgi:SAM-dependent methyltransferase